LTGSGKTTAIQHKKLVELRTALAKATKALEVTQQQLAGETEQRQIVQAREADAVQKLERATALCEESEKLQKATTDKLHISTSTRSAIQADLEALQARYKRLRYEKLALDSLLLQVTQSLGKASDYLHHLNPSAAKTESVEKSAPKMQTGEP